MDKEALFGLPNAGRQASVFGAPQTYNQIFGMPNTAPRVAQYTQLMQQADPNQRQALVQHLYSQFQAGNQNVVPYLQDLQAKGIIQNGMISGSPSSAPIQQAPSILGDAWNTVVRANQVPNQMENGGALGRKVDNMPISHSMTAGQFANSINQGTYQTVIQPAAHDLANANYGRAAVDLGAGIAKGATYPAVVLGANAYEQARGKDNVKLPFYGDISSFGSTVQQQGVVPALAGEAMNALGTGALIHGIAESPGVIKAAAPVVADKAMGAARAYADTVKSTLTSQRGNGINPQSGYIAGTNAGRFNDMAAAGKVQGNSFERSDSKMKVDAKAAAALDQGRTLSLGQVVKHKELQQDYPGVLQQTRVQATTEVNHPVYDKASNTIYVRNGSSLVTDAGRSKLVHEVQHAIDHAEGREAGTTPEFEAYKNMSDQQQRAVERKIALQPSIDSLKELVRRGNITKEEYQARPEVKAYNEAESALKGVSRGENPEDMRDYLANGGEARARAAAERSKMSQKELEANPQRLSVIQQAVGKQGQLAYAKDDLHLDEPTPYESVDISDRKAVGAAKGKTEAYLKRIDQALAQDPKNTQLRQRRLQLANDLKQFQSAYRNPAKLSELDQWAKDQGIDTTKAANSPEKDVPGLDSYMASLTKESGEDTKTVSQTKKAIATEKALLEYNKYYRNIDLKKSESTADAIGNEQQIHTGIEKRMETLYEEAVKLDDHDKILGDKLEGVTDPAKIEEIAKDAHKPEQFLKAAQALRDLTDFMIAADREAGGKTPYIKGFVHHNWDMEDPKLQEYMKAHNLEYNGYGNQPRIFRSYKEGEALGFNRKFSNVFEDTLDYGANGINKISHQLLLKGLQEAHPDDVMVGANPGKGFVNTNITGLRDQSVSFSPELAKEMKGYEPMLQSKAEAVYNKTNRLLKEGKLSLGGFHVVNIGKRYAGYNLFSPLKGLLGGGRAIRALFDQKYFNQIRARAVERGVYDFGAKWGGTFGKTGDFHPGSDEVFDVASKRGDLHTGGTLKQKTGKLNPIPAFNKAVFNRFIEVLKLDMTERAMKSGHFKAGGKWDMNTENGAKQLRQYFAQSNDLLGGLNYQQLARSINARRIASSVVLAPDYQEGGLRTTGRAINPLDWGAGGQFAKRAVIGNIVVTAALSEIGTKLSTGHFSWEQPQKDGDPKKLSTLEEIWKNDFESPQVKINEVENNKKKSVALPQTPLSEFAAPVGGLVSGDSTNAKHWLQARTAALPSLAAEAYTGQNYYGQDITKDRNGNPVSKLQMAANLLQGQLPIPGQNLANKAQGRQSWIDVAINTIGGRVRNDPTDPANHAAASFVNTVAQVTKAQNYDTQKVLNTYYSRVYNPATGKAVGLDNMEKMDNSRLLADNPNALKAVQQVQQKQSQVTGQPLDPMWSLPFDKLQAFMKMQGDYYKGQDYQQVKYQNPWISDFQQVRSQFFTDHPLPPGTNDPNVIDYPQLPQEVENLMTLRTQLGSIPSGQRTADQTQLLNSLYNNPLLNSANQVLDQYTNQVRTAEGGTPFAPIPQASPYVQQQLNSGNYNDPQVQGYFNAQSAAKLAGPFGNGVGAGLGGSNVDPRRIANVAAGLTENGKPSSYAKSSSSAAARHARSEMKYLLKETKYAGKKMKNNLKYQHHVAGTQLPRVQNQPILTAQQHAARNHAIAKAKNASKRHIA